VYPGRPQVNHKGNIIQSDAIEISTIRADAKLMKYLVEGMATLDYSNIELVSRNLKFTMPEVYASTLSAHNDYLANHRNISVAGLSADAMDAQPVITSHGDHFPTMRDAVLSLEGVSQV
jgi:hypothetical protein